MEEFAEVVQQCQAERKRLWTILSESKQKIYNLEQLEYIDENQSVAWNKKEKARLIRSEKAKMAAVRRKYEAAYNPVISFIKNEIKEEYGFSNNLADLIYQYGYEKGHSYGWSEIRADALGYAEFAEKIIDMSTNTEEQNAE